MLVPSHRTTIPTTYMTMLLHGHPPGCSRTPSCLHPIQTTLISNHNYHKLYHRFSGQMNNRKPCGLAFSGMLHYTQTKRRVTNQYGRCLHTTGTPSTMVFHISVYVKPVVFPFHWLRFPYTINNMVHFLYS